MNSIWFDPTIEAAQKSLGGLSLRKDLIAQNIVNVDTPGYKAQDVNFETSLKMAMNRGSSLALRTTNGSHLNSLPSESSDVFQISLRKGGTERADGNNVDIDRELNAMTETGIRYQGLTTTVNIKLNLLKAIANAR
ncbi:MAG: flagellar basal body rod protein FlgB [Leptolinea sp.]